MLIASAGVGFAIARAASPAPTKRVVAPIAKTQAVRCVDLAPAAVDDTCPEARAVWLQCEAALAVATAAHPTTRMPFPAEIPEAQQPGPWTDRLADALVSCDIPATLEVTDCDEYPCAAALRIAPEDLPKATDAWNACAPLAELHLGYTATDVHCPDLSTETAYVVTTNELADWQPLFEGAVDPQLAAMVAYGRRTESVLQLWGCNVPAR